MASKRKAVLIAGTKKTHEPTPSLPAAEILSFLKETRGVPSWNIREMAKSLNIGRAEATKVTALLQAQGYVEPSRADEWLTTVSGETVSGSKAPRFTPESVAAGLSGLAERIKVVNQDRTAPFEIVTAVAFGDFLRDRARLQAPDVGVQLVRRLPTPNDSGSAVEQAARRKFLRELRGKFPVLSLRSYEEWMSSRSHRKLL